MRELPALELDLSKPEEFGNVAEKLDEDERRTLANDLSELIRMDESSMEEWEGKAQGYLDKLEGQGDAHPQDREQEGANEKAPPATEMTLSTVIQFAARATDALLGEPDLAKASEPGGEKLASWVSSQLRTADPNWTLDTDPLVIHMGVTGLSWRKRDYDDDEQVFHSMFIPSVGTNKVIINKNARGNGERAPRITHQFERYPYEINRSIERKKWIDYDPKFDEADPQAPKRFYEIDAWLDLDDDGIDEPWTIVISRDDMAEVVRIRPRWSSKTVVDTKEALIFNPIRRFYPYKLLPDPKGGFFPMGFGHLLDRIESSSDDLLASIVDTAQSEAENGGVFGGNQFGMPDKIELKGNRLTFIPTDGQPLSNVVQPFPAKSVSPSSVAMLEKLLSLGNGLAGTVNILENIPASTTATVARGIIDSGQQVQSAVHRRMVAGLTQELRMFVQMADAYGALPDGTSAGSNGGGVAITADPQLATEMQRAALGGVYMQMIEMEVPVWNKQEAATRFCQVMRIPDPEKLVAQPQPPQATPDEKMKGALGMMKHQNDKIKATGDLALKITQSIKNLADAGASLQNMDMVQLQMAQLEQAVKSMVEDAGNANGIGGGLDGGSGDAGAAGAGAGAPDGQGADLSGGAPGGGGGTG